ncbi:MAG: hypothetical protein HKN47_07035 [Pirellulaceae bacterium]|nr:hypothetical protein [Pirellulaceae bacterium]
MVRNPRRRSVAKKSLRFESLESRRLLAADGLIGHWPLDHFSSGFLADEAAANNDLQISPSTPIEDSDRGQAIVLTGTDPFGASNRDANLSGLSDALSVGIWVKPSDVANGGFAFAISPAGTQLRLIGNQLEFHVTTLRNGQLTDNIAKGTFDLENGKWYHIAGTFDGTNLIAYVNGVAVGDATANGDLRIDGDLYVGSGSIFSGSFQDFRGSLDDAKLFNRALTGEQVRALLETTDGIETTNEFIPYAPGTDPVRVNPGVEITSDESSFVGGALTLAANVSQFKEGDHLGIATTDQISVEGNTVRFHREGTVTPIGSVNSSDNGTVMTVRFSTAAATPVAAEALARAFTFHSELANPEVGLRGLRIILATDQGRAAFADQVTIVVGEINNTPLVVETSAGASGFVPQQGPVTVDPQIAFVSTLQDFSDTLLRVSLAEGSGRDSDQLSVQSTQSVSVNAGVVDYVGGTNPVTVGVISGGQVGTPLTVSLNQSATAAAIQAVARAIAYDNTAAETPVHARFVRFAVDAGNDNEASDIKKIEITQPGVNQPPIIEVPDGATLFTEGDPAVVLLPSVDISDSDSADFGGGKLEIDFVQESRREGDRLSVRSTNQITFDNGDVFRPDGSTPVRIGEYAIGENSSEIVFLFNSNVTPELAEAIALTVQFGNAVDEPVIGDRFVRFTIHDGDGESDSVTRRVEVGGVNDAPVVITSDGVNTFNEGSEPIRIDPAIHISDIDSADFAGGRLLVRFQQQSRREGDFLSLQGSEAIVIDGNLLKRTVEGQTVTVGQFDNDGQGGLVVEFNEHANDDLVQHVASLVRFGNQQADIGETDRQIEFKVLDGDGGDAADTVILRVVEINEPPVVQATEGSTLYETGEPSVIVAPQIEINDPDTAIFNGGQLIVTMAEQSGAEGDVLSIKPSSDIAISVRSVYRVVNGQLVFVGEIRESSVGSGELVVDLGEGATLQNVQLLARRVSYHSTRDDVGNHVVRFVRFSVTDGDGGSASDIKQVNLFTRPDDDFDGVDDAVERDGPNNGDGNNDGIPDDQQDNVASLRGSENRFLTISTPLNTRLANVKPMANPSTIDSPQETTFPVGFVDFEVLGAPTAGESVVIIHLEPGSSANMYYVFGPTPANPTPHWYPFTFDGQTGAKIFADRIELYYVDGQRGDTDLTENGIIVDPGAPALTEYPWQNPTLGPDVDNDGEVTPGDLLDVINAMANGRIGALPKLATGTDQLAAQFLDTNRDNQLTPGDILQVINFLAEQAQSNQNLPPQSEFIGGMLSMTSADDDDDDRWDEAIVDVVGDLN